MAIATITFDHCDTEADGGQADILGRKPSWPRSDRRFGGSELAAAAQDAYRRVRADIDADANLFGWAEALRAGLAANPEAREWDEFERDATAGIEPFCFSIRFRNTA
jgi:hypothetical protein